MRIICWLAPTDKVATQLEPDIYRYRVFNSDFQSFFLTLIIFFFLTLITVISQTGLGDPAFVGVDTYSVSFLFVTTVKF